MTRRQVALLVALGALALTASYPPFALPVLSFVALAPGLVLLRRAEREGTPRRAFAWGFWYGLGTHSLVLYWLIVALWRFTRLSALGYLATITVLGLWIGALFWFTVQVRRRIPRVPLWVVFPIGWTAVEWAIGHLGDVAFPWLGLGTSLTETPLLVQWADLAGARGVTLWLVWCNVVLVDVGSRVAERRGEGRAGAWRGAAAVVVSVALALGYGAWRMRTLPMRDLAVVALIQPNEGFREKWEQGRADTVVDKLVRLSEVARQRARPALYIWPEAAIPGYLQNQPRWVAAIAGLARESDAPILSGTLWARFRGPGDYDYYNAAAFFDSSGDWRSHPVYGKQYLVPVVERVPFVPPRWFGNLRFFGGFSRGREVPLYQTAFGRLGVLICYESAFEDLSRRYRRLGADVLVNITNDAWYGRTSAPAQHAAHLVMRAIETRAGIARPANSGISEFLDPLGRSYAATQLETEAVVTDTLRTSDVIPLYTRWGDWVGRLSVLAMLCFAGALWWQRWRLGP